MQGGRHLCHMGDPHSCFPGFFGNFFIFKVQAVSICLDMHHNPFACVLENYEASKTSSEKEAENAAALVNILMQVAPSESDACRPQL